MLFQQGAKVWTTNTHRIPLGCRESLLACQLAGMLSYVALSFNQNFKLRCLAYFFCKFLSAFCVSSTATCFYLCIFYEIVLQNFFIFCFYTCKRVLSTTENGTEIRFWQRMFVWSWEWTWKNIKNNMEKYQE